MSIKNNTASLQNLLEQINALPEAGGVELPELQNEGSTEDLMLNKELINADGDKITGTFSIDSELTTQDSLIAQIQTALEGKAAGGSGSGISGAVETGALTITDNGMYEPGVNEYFLSSDLLQSSKRTHIILTCQVNQRIHYVLIMITRETVSDSFTVWLGNLQNSHYNIASGQMQINENSIRVQGTIDTTTPITFLAW